MAIEYPDNNYSPIKKMIYRKLRKTKMSVLLWENIYNMYPQIQGNMQ
jgi:hypothetical protein